ncbi:YbfB/YjiJ family MFS transporter [Nocardia sp. NPDC049737]|uniref:YbfB/YjiJ family MFS transporter n=1 Tax=Nocardia sp. NPDC049737 TaxID=3154358 RepID=UPI00342CEEE8
MALASTALNSDYLVLLITRAAAGAAGALVFIAGGMIAARLATCAGASTPITIYFAGAGLGIAFSRTIIPLLSEQWRLAWVLLGMAAGLATVLSWTAAAIAITEGNRIRRPVLSARSRSMSGSAAACG